MQSGFDRPAATDPAVRPDLRPETAGMRATLSPGRFRGAERAPPLPTPLVYSRSHKGRSPSYVRIMERMFGACRAGLGDVLFSRAPLLFLRIEEAFFLYVLASLLRALTGRRTAGLLFKPVPLVASPRLHHRFKGRILQWLKHFEAIHTLTVLPFSVHPAFATVARGWIYDVQLWDITDEERAAVEALRRERHPDARPVLTALGTQSLHRGFDLFAAIYAGCDDLRARFQFISCGTVAPAAIPYAAAFCRAGGVAVNRTVSDAELLGAYAASDAVWCLYPPVGDHASGILGRAAQLGIPVVVRYGSLAHRLCIVENVPHVPAAADGVADRLAGPLPLRDDARGRAAAMRFASHSEATLRAALGLPDAG